MSFCGKVQLCAVLRAGREMGEWARERTLTEEGGRRRLRGGVGTVA